MRLEERRVAVVDLHVGMYVCRLDRDWEGTPFPLQGVLIRSRNDIEVLAKYSRHVYVDTELGLAPRAPAPAAARPRAPRTYAPGEIEALRNQVAYRDSVSFDDELPRAEEAQVAAAAFASRVLDDVRHGRPVSADEVRGAVEPMVNSILRNADAFLWIDSLRQRGSYDYDHALGCSALAVAFGRHIGLPEELLVDVASGALLLDVGKLRVREELMSRKDALSREEMQEVRRHVDHCLSILEEGGEVPEHLRAMIRSHHERDDGSGYPDQLAGERIPLLARIAGVVDSYDAMVRDRPFRKAVAQHQALQALYRERNRLFAAEIVEQFMQCMNVYPTGSLVELTTGEVAIVMAQNQVRRLRPKVMVLTDPGKALLAQFRPLDLMAQAEGGGDSVQVIGAIAAGSYGLDPGELYL